MQKIKSTLRQLWADESGQGATEYILLLVIVVAVAFIFKDKITGIIKTKMEALSGDIQGFTSDAGG
jgi:Flp pilus assembly pilin Flp